MVRDTAIYAMEPIQILNTNIDECHREGDPILFARGSDPYHHAHSNLLATYVRLQEAGLLQYRNSLAPEDPFSVSCRRRTWPRGRPGRGFPLLPLAYQHIKPSN